MINIDQPRDKLGYPTFKASYFVAPGLQAFQQNSDSPDTPAGANSQVLLAMSFYALELCPNCDLAGGLIKVRYEHSWESHEDWVTLMFLLPVDTQPVNERLQFANWNIAIFDR